MPGTLRTAWLAALPLVGCYPNTIHGDLWGGGTGLQVDFTEDNLLATDLSAQGADVQCMKTWACDDAWIQLDPGRSQLPRGYYS